MGQGERQVRRKDPPGRHQRRRTSGLFRGGHTRLAPVGSASPMPLGFQKVTRTIHLLPHRLRVTDPPSGRRSLPAAGVGKFLSSFTVVGCCARGRCTLYASCADVPQVSQPAVSPISQSADRPSRGRTRVAYRLRVGKPARQQTWKSALQESPLRPGGCN